LGDGLRKKNGLANMPAGGIRGREETKNQAEKRKKKRKDEAIRHIMQNVVGKKDHDLAGKSCTGGKRDCKGGAGGEG